MSRQYPEHPLIGVGAVVIKENSVLLIKRSKPPRVGEWSLPGGAQELGETALAAALREISEETAVTVTPVGLIDVVDLIQRDDAEIIQHHYTLIDFAFQWTSGQPKAGDDALDARFFKLTELTDLSLWSETLRVIDEGFKLVATHQNA